MWKVATQTFGEFVEDECPRMAAALAYYTFFALPAMLVLIVFVGGLLVDKAAVASRLRDHFEETIGRAGAEQLTSILQHASQPHHSWRGWIVGSVMLVVGATGALGELQTALNRAWRVEPDPNQGGVRSFFIKRLLSVAMLLGIAILLLLSLMISWALAAFGHWIDGHGAVWFSSRVMTWLHTGVSIFIITLLFASVLRFLPDAQVDWSDVWIGAVTTSVLFWLGQFVLALYFGWSHPTSAYGAAGSLALVLLWIYYSAMILFLGAEFTQVMAERRGKFVPPEPGARKGTAHCAGHVPRQCAADAPTV